MEMACRWSVCSEQTAREAGRPPEPPVRPSHSWAPVSDVGGGGERAGQVSEVTDRHTGRGGRHN